MAVVKCNWSGGKDSSCATHLHLLQGDKCIVCCYIPMFTDEIPLILKQHYEFILQTAERFKSMGAEVYTTSGMTYWDYVTHIKQKGDYKGEIMGFPSYITGQCGFKNYSKVKALDTLTKNVEYDYMDIGIAFDEIDRYSQINDKKRSILVEKKITEQMALEYCRANLLCSPLYAKYKRDGCLLCPQKRSAERVEWFNQYPEAFQLVLELQEIVKKQKSKHLFPLRNNKWFIEENLQMNIFSGELEWIIN